MKAIWVYSNKFTFLLRFTINFNYFNNKQKFKKKLKVRHDNTIYKLIIYYSNY